tara:strand:+ start:2537 stop:2752 length:216 start_codon:yes stop_codon:yes gene_type:complete
MRNVNSIPIIIVGIIITIFGIIFGLQGHGMLGPDQSFMYESPDWIDNGNYIAMFGVVIVLIGYIVEKKKSI